jgi:hypothetical protein
LDKETFRELEAELAPTHAALADKLGMSVISVKRMATEGQVITEQTARQLVAFVLLKRKGLENEFEKLLARYHDDTLK